MTNSHVHPTGNSSRASVRAVCGHQPQTLSRADTDQPYSERRGWRHLVACSSPGPAERIYDVSASDANTAHVSGSLIRPSRGPACRSDSFTIFLPRVPNARHNTGDCDDASARRPGTHTPPITPGGVPVTFAPGTWCAIDVAHVKADRVNAGISAYETFVEKARTSTVKAHARRFSVRSTIALLP